MDNQGNFPEQLSETIEQLKARLEFEAYFSQDYLPNSDIEAKKNLISDALSGEKQGISELIQGKLSKEVLIQPLYQKVLQCCLCDLHKTRTNIVFGDGSLDSKLVFIGEAPGHDEDIQGKPFVGLAGELLTKIINAMHLRRADVYIANVLKCRPLKNRNPLPDEVACCKPYLIELLDIIKPRVICTLGKFATHALLNQTIPISKLRGKWFEFKKIKLMPTFHPAYLLRNPKDKKLVWDDMKKIMDALK